MTLVTIAPLISARICHGLMTGPPGARRLRGRDDAMTGRGSGSAWFPPWSRKLKLVTRGAGATWAHGMPPSCDEQRCRPAGSHHDCERSDLSEIGQRWGLVRAGKPKRSSALCSLPLIPKSSWAAADCREALSITTQICHRSASSSVLQALMCLRNRHLVNEPVGPETVTARELLLFAAVRGRPSLMEVKVWTFLDGQAFAS